MNTSYSLNVKKNIAKANFKSNYLPIIKIVLSAFIFLANNNISYSQPFQTGTGSTNIMYRAGCGTDGQAVIDINLHRLPGVHPNSNITTTQWASNHYPIDTCGKFLLYYDDSAYHTHKGFDDPIEGPTRVATYCAVVNYIQSIFNFNHLAGTDYIRIHVESWDTGANPPSPYQGAFAVGGPTYLSPWPSDGIYDGLLFDHANVPPYTAPLGAFDGVVTVNFTGNVYIAGDVPFIWHDTGSSPVRNCQIDLYSVLLHETTHAMGFISMVDVNSGTRLPYSSTLFTYGSGYEAFSLFDYTFLYEASGPLGYQYTPPALSHIIRGPWNTPTLNLADSVIPIQGNIWLDSITQFKGNSDSANPNQPVYSGFAATTALGNNDVFQSFMSHLDASYLSWSYRANGSPGYQPMYVMAPFYNGGEERRTYTLPEIRALLKMKTVSGGYGYTLDCPTCTNINGVSANNRLVIGNSPVNKEINTDGDQNLGAANDVYPDSHYDYQGTPQQAVDFTITNPGTPLTYSITTDYHLVSPDSNSLSIALSTLYNIRGCGIHGNDEKALVLSAGNTVLTYTPRSDFLGLAQFGFNLTDGKEPGAYVVKTVNVTAGATYANVSNPNTPAGHYGPELVLNGGYEQGTQTRVQRTHEFDTNESLLDGWFEGYYYVGNNFSDSHPLDWISYGWTSSMGVNIDSSLKACNTLLYPGEFGAQAFSNPNPVWHTPVPDDGGPPSNARYHWLNGAWNYLQINNSYPKYNPNVCPMQHCTYYKVKFDVNYAYALYENPLLTKDSITVGFTDSIKYPANPEYNFYVTIDDDTITSTWKTITKGFWYCGTVPATGPWFMNLQVGGFNAAGVLVYDPNMVFLDNVSLVVDSTPPPMTVSATANPSTICSGSGTTLTATVANGGCSQSYVWAPGGATTTSVNVNPASTTVYTCTVTDVCALTATTTVTVTVYPSPTVTTTINSEVSCNGGSSGSVTANPSSGTSPYTYSWNPSGKTTQTATGLSAGTYTVTVTDAHGCTGTVSVTITQPTAITATIAITQPACGSSNGDAKATPSGGTSPYTYSWNPSGRTTQTATGLSAGIYTVTVTDHNGCTYSTTATLNNSSFSASITITQPTCANSNGDAKATPSGGTSPYTYLWSPGGQTTQTISSLSAGTYTVKVTSNNGCITYATVTLTQPTLLTTTASISSNISCHGGTGSITTTPSGGTGAYTYSWNPSGKTTQTATGMSAGIYTITVTDNSGCTATASINLTQPAAISISISTTNILCNGNNTGSATATVSGGTPQYTYSWTGGQTSSSATALSAGTYTVTVTDAIGCTGTASVTITQPTSATLTFSPVVNVSCNNGDNGSAKVNVSGGTSPYTYSWSPVSGTTNTITGLTAGTYTVNVTDAHGCSYSNTVTITQPYVLIVNTSILSESCSSNFGEIIANPNGGTTPYTYLWSPSSQTTQTATGLTAGTYTVSITDHNGCTTSAIDTITSTCNKCWDVNRYNILLNNPDAKLLSRAMHRNYYSCDSILISGTFTVDTNFYFYAVDASFTPNALINVVDSSNFWVEQGACSTVTSHLHAASSCDTMWRGIFVHPGSTFGSVDDPLIEDADTALYLMNKGTIQGLCNSTITTYNKNWKDVVIQPSNYEYEGNFGECIFTCRNYDSILTSTPFNYVNTGNNDNWSVAHVTTCLYPHAGQLSYMGWEFDSVKGYNQFERDGADIFDNLKYGIYSMNSNLEIATDTFSNITTTGTFAGGVAIYARGNPTGSGDTLKVGAPPTIAESMENNFKNCTVGVQADSGFKYIDVAYNKMKDPNATTGNYGVLIQAMNEANDSLFINQDTITNFNKGIACSMNTYVNANINYNLITETVCNNLNWTGIAISETSGGHHAHYIVDTNTIGVLYEGIVATGISSSSINANKITIGASACTSYRTGGGIGLNGCDTVQVGCNVITADIIPNTYTGIAEAQSKFVSIINNNTTDTHYHIAFVSTPITGDNLWDNSMTTTVSGRDTAILSGSLTALGASANASNNTFTGTFSCEANSPGSPTYFVTSPPYPIPTGCPAPSHATGSNVTNTCASIPARSRSHSMIHNSEIDSATMVLMENIALSKDTFYVLQDTNMALSKEGLLTTLWGNSYLLSNPIFKRFEDSMNNSSMGQLLAIDTNMLSLSPSISYSSMLANLNSIIPANNVEANLQTAGIGYLLYRINDTLSANELATLRTLAGKCPDWDGNGVYQARALLSLFDPPSTVYSDVCGSNYESHRPEKKNTNSPFEPMFNLYPNPNNGNFTLEYDLGVNNTGKVILFNTVGQQIGEYTLNGSQGEMSISNSELSNGVYLWKLYSNAQIIKYGKVVIIK